MEGERGEGRKDMRCGWLSDEQVGRKWKEHDDDAWVQEQQEAPLFRSVGARDTVRCAALCGGADGSLHRPNRSPDLARPSTNPLPNAQTCLSLLLAQK